MGSRTPARFHFPGRASVQFDRATFTGEANLAGARFNEEARFDRAKFDGQGRYGGDARFDRAKFTGDARFDEARFSGWYVGFDEARLYRASFDGARVAESRRVVLPVGWITRAAQPAEGEEEGWLYIVREEDSTEQPTETLGDGPA